MKTSSYDDDDDADAVSADTPGSTGRAAPESYEATDALGSELSAARGYEASFAKCKVPPAAPSIEEQIPEEYSEIFAKCSLTTVEESYETPVSESYEAPIETSYRTFTECSLPPVVESYETPVMENCTTPVTETEAPVPESSEAQITNVAPQINDYAPSMPPPVPKRTLLPSKTPKETPAAPQTTQPEIPVTEETNAQHVTYKDIDVVSPEEVTNKTETGAERWSDSTSVSLPGQVEDVETVSSDPGNAQCEPVSEMYYTASSEVSLLSDTELADKVQTEEDESKDDRKNVISGHVAAMRERFESMTRTNTPCPDLARSLSPSLEVFRNMSPSPDRLA